MPNKEWLPWSRMPASAYIKGPYFTNRKKRREQMCREWRERGIKRRKASINTLVAQMRFQRGHQQYAFLKKKVMRKLGLQHKTLDQWLTADFVRVGAQPASSFMAITNAPNAA